MLAYAAVEGPGLPVPLGELALDVLVLDDKELPILPVGTGGRPQGTVFWRFLLAEERPEPISSEVLAVDADVFAELEGEA